MPIELQAFLGVCLLYWILNQLIGLAKISQAGIGWGMGNRETSPEFPLWIDRIDRAQRNLLESLPLFAALIAAILYTNASCALTAAGALTFLTARVAHAFIFIAGIPVWRTVAYYFSLVGLALLALKIL